MQINEHLCVSVAPLNAIKSIKQVPAKTYTHGLLKTLTIESQRFFIVILNLSFFLKLSSFTDHSLNLI